MISQSLLKEFQAKVGADNVFSEDTDRLTYSYDAAVLEPVMPGLVVRPATGEALGQVVRLCNQNRIPLTVRGAGTNLSGGTIPIADGVVVVTNALNRIEEINEQDMYAVVQPGVVTAKLAAAAEAKGLFYPPDPGSQAVSTFGGNVAENAGGLRGLKYGVTRDYVTGLQFFSVDGEPVKTGSRTVKCATGYNLTGLMVGSEGTLGVFNKITLKLIPLPQDRKSMVAVFDEMGSASEAVSCSPNWISPRQRDVRGWPFPSAACWTIFFPISPGTASTSCSLTGSVSLCRPLRPAAGFRRFPLGTPKSSGSWCGTTWLFLKPAGSNIWSPPVPPVPPRSARCGR